MAERGPCREQLIETEHAVHNVATNEAKRSFEIERRQHLPTEDGLLEARRISIHGRDHQIGNFVAPLIPSRAIRQYWRDMLAKKACDVASCRRECVIQRGWDHHLDHRLTRPAERTRLGVSAVVVGQARTDDYAGREMIASFRKTRKSRQIGKRYIHPERA